jgi:hypothetical protein
VEDAVEVAEVTCEKPFENPSWEENLAYSIPVLLSTLVFRELKENPT